jgi:pimeloyl-ACP methyl ester carboxylesterase
VTRVALVGGTWAYDGRVPDDEWYAPGSAFVRAVLAPHGIEPLWPDDPFVWDGEADGVGWWGRERKHLVWQAAAANLVYRLKALPLEQRNLIAHSHGGQVALYAASVLPLNRLITVTTPVRGDMVHTIAVARANIGAWWHLYSTGFLRDKMQWFGEFFDGVWNIPPKRTFDAANQNVACKDVGHSGLLCEAKYYDQWTTTGAAAFMAGEMGAGV